MTVPATSGARTGDVRTPGLQLKVKWESGKLSLDAEAVPLSEVLLGVSRATGIEVTGAKGLSNLVSMHLAGVELFQALRELLLHVDYAITAGSQGSASLRGTRVIIVGRSSPDSLSAASVTESETNAPAAEAAIQAADSTPADADPQASQLPSIEAWETGEDREAVRQAQQQLANQTVEADQQSLMAAALGELKDADPSANTGAVQPPTQNADAVGLEASSDGLPGTDPRLDASQTEMLAAIEAAAMSQDREALGKYMQDANAAAQAGAFDALPAHDNPAGVENLLAEIKDVSQPVRLQALQLLTESPQADEQTVMTTLIDALNGADPSLSEYAAHALAERGTPDAMNALSEMLKSSDPSTRLMILQSVAQTEAGPPLLRAALSDSNETVRSAAAALLQRGEAARNP
ncbi:MAG TPA: HEAT repeat domain-containing protein [Candidatus Dormibacteraeota bacterium]|nr:HEAT repeat domain-containing protein [Candidatus Dormibacteraeota bacterium]